MTYTLPSCLRRPLLHNRSSCAWRDRSSESIIGDPDLSGMRQCGDYKDLALRTSDNTPVINLSPLNLERQAYLNFGKGWAQWASLVRNYEGNSSSQFDSIRKPKFNHVQRYFWMRLENQCSKFKLEFRFHSFNPLGEWTDRTTWVKLLKEGNLQTLSWWTLT